MVPVFQKDDSYRGSATKMDQIPFLRKDLVWSFNQHLYSLVNQKCHL